MRKTEPAKKYDKSSIEILRVLAIFAVICIHVQPFKNIENYSIVPYLINISCRFSVPVFFLISGYFLFKPSRPSLWPYIQKLGILFIAWTLIYRIMPGSMLSLVRSSVRDGFLKGFVYPWINACAELKNYLCAHPFNLFLEGYAHLWFLMALIFGVLTLQVFIKAKKEQYILPCAVVLYIIGLLGKAYANTPFGSVYLAEHVNTRNGPFFSVIFIAIGYWLARQNVKQSLRFAVGLAMTGLVIQIVEIYVLRYRDFSTQLIPDYSIGTLPFGVGIFMIALARPAIGANTAFARMGRLVLGIYVSHILIIGNCGGIFLQRFFNPFIWQIFFPFWVFACSCAFVIFLQKYKLTSWLVQ